MIKSSNEINFKQFKVINCNDLLQQTGLKCSGSSIFLLCLYILKVLCRLTNDSIDMQCTNHFCRFDNVIIWRCYKDGRDLICPEKHENHTQQIPKGKNFIFVHQI